MEILPVTRKSPGIIRKKVYHIKNNGDITALYIAELKAQPEILRLLKDAGAIK